MLTPQPLGIFPLPAGYLLLPRVEGAEVCLAELMRGRVPDSFPEPLRFYQLALAGEAQAALNILSDDAPETRYNRFVLSGDPALYAELAETFFGEWRVLLDVAAYTLDLLDAPPLIGEARDERLALTLMAQATYCLEHEDAAGAIASLDRAVSIARAASPVFAAQLLGALAAAKREAYGPGREIVQLYREALHLLKAAGLDEVRAEMWLNLGITHQEMARGSREVLLEAAKCYQRALRTFTRASHPEPYALAQTNLALTYLAMPLTEASDQLRLAIAVQALREALTVYTPETHPPQWASVQLNLANALQWLPSTHPRENLEQAVEVYEAVLNARNAEQDPLGYARVLANQGNALAHLGMLASASAKLRAALALFEAHGDVEAARAARDVLGEVEAAPREAVAG